MYGCPARLDTLAVLRSEHASKFPFPELLDALPDVVGVAPVAVVPVLSLALVVVDALFEDEPLHAARLSVSTHTAVPIRGLRRRGVNCIRSIHSSAGGASALDEIIGHADRKTIARRWPGLADTLLV